MQHSSTEGSGPGRQLAVPVRVYLRAAWFVDTASLESEPPAWEAAELDFSIDVHRRSLRGLTVALTIRSGAGAAFGIEVTYAGDFELDGAVPPEEINGACTDVVFRAAPDLLLPYVREEVSRLTERSRGEALVLPFLGLLFEPRDGFVMPGPPGNQEDAQS